MNDSIKTYKIYKHTAPNGKGYIGFTERTLEQRAGKDGRGYKDSKYFWPAIQKFKWKNFKHELLLTTRTKEMALKAEEALTIGCDTQWPNGYNEQISSKRTEEVRERISQKLQGRDIPYEMTDEIKQKISNSLIGHKRAKESIQKGVESRRGYRHSEETKRKISEAHKGQPGTYGHLGHKHSEETKKKISEIKKGKPAWNKGLTGYYHVSEENKKRISEKLKGKPKNRHSTQSQILTN